MGGPPMGIRHVGFPIGRFRHRGSSIGDPPIPPCVATVIACSHWLGSSSVCLSVVVTVNQRVSSSDAVQSERLLQMAASDS